MFFTRRLYMDFASSTPLHFSVAFAMLRAFLVYGNPSSPHQEGRAARSLVEHARERVARALHTRPETLIFTGSGTESNVSALIGFVEALVERGAEYRDLHLVVSDIEHPSVVEPVRVLMKKGVEVSFVSPTPDGIITPEAVRAALTSNTVLVSVVAVQSEIGQIQPLKDIAHMLERWRKEHSHSLAERIPECPFPVFHSDASQGSLFVDLSPERLGVHLATYDAQKIQGPKGVGVLYKHSRVPLAPLIPGGSQERKIRAGTENTLAIVGCGAAFTYAAKKRIDRAARVAKVRDYFIAELKRLVPHSEVNGGMKRRIANNVHISIPDTDGDFLAVLLDARGVTVSPRSACIASGTNSKTIETLGKGSSLSRGTLRFTFGPSVSRRDARRAVRALKSALSVIHVTKT